MKKTSVYLDEELDDALARRAADEQVTKAELIRRTLAAEVGHGRLRPKARSIGIASSGLRDLGSRDEEYLADGFGEWR